MRYVVDRARAIIRHLISLRGLLLAIGLVGAGVAVFSDGAPAMLGFLAFALGVGGLLAVVSFHQSELRARMTSTAQAAERPIGEPSRAKVEAVEQPSLTDLRQGFHAARRIRLGGHESESLLPGVLQNAAVLVTIAVLASDNENEVVPTLDAIRRQTFERWRCVVVDDASTDGTVEAVWSFVGADDRFRLIRNKKKSGRGSSLNTATRVAEGDFLGFCDPGDVFDQLALDSLLRLAYQQTRDHVVAWSPDVVDTPVGSGRSLVEERLVDFVSLSPAEPVGLSGTMVDRAFLRKESGFDETLMSKAADWRFVVQLTRSGHSLAPTGGGLFSSRIRAEVSPLDDVKVEYDAVARQILAGEPNSEFPHPQDAYSMAAASAVPIMSAAISGMLDGDRNTVPMTLSALETSDWDWILRRLDLPAMAANEVVRRSGVSKDEALKIVQASELVSELTGHALQNAKPIESASPDDMQIDVLFAPENAAQVSAMRQKAAQLNGLRHAFLLVDSVSGDQGAAEAMSHVPEKVLSFSTLAIRAPRIRAVVVGFPRTAAIEHVVDAAKAAGTVVFEIADEYTATMRLEEARSSVLELQVPEDRSLTTVVNSGDSEIPPRIDMPASLAAERGPDSDFEVEEYPQIPFDGRTIADFKDRHPGERCVIIGNGPSLNALDLSLLSKEFTIGVNGIFYAAENMGFDPTYYVVEDTAVVNDNLEEIRAYRAGHKFFPSIYRSRIGEADNVSYFMMNRGFYEKESESFCVPRFSVDAAQRLYTGQSVTTINLQLAYFMGFREVILIGMDFSYVIPEDAERDGDNITSVGGDPNHFHADYFGKGKVWKDPKLDRVLANYQLAKLMFEADGRRIVNATPGGKLELFDRVDYEATILDRRFK